MRVTRACRSSTAIPSSTATMATICWASTSSGLRGTTVGSISPARMRLATTAHSSRSARNLGKIRPLLTSPTLWPARPMRWRPLDTDFGDSTWSTRSTAPMSMPSSSDDVATRHGSSPDLSISSTTSRSSRASEPWWARAISLPWSSLRRSARRSAPRRLLTKTIVERVLRGRARAAPGRSPARSTGAWWPSRPQRNRCRRRCRARPSTRRARGSSGRAACGRRCRRCVQVRRGPTRKRPTSSSGDCVALRPIRWTSRSASASRRSSVSARCAPRLVWATAWISSTITHSAPVSISRACEVRMRYSDSGVVMRTSGGLRRMAARSRCGVSPVRMATSMSAPMPFSGARRLRSMS